MSGHQPRAQGISLSDLEANPNAEMWAKARRDGIAHMVREEPGTIWADGHALLTCGSHTGHSVRAIAYCQDADWATAIVEALAAIALAKGAGV